jgi:predicted ATPase
MIQSVTIRNFKRLEDVTIPLGERIVFAGPNNCGKTSAIQALGMWRLALDRWLEKRADNPRSKAKTRTTRHYGVAITRRELTVSPTRETRLLWHNCAVMGSGKERYRIEILAKGVSHDKPWEFGMELDYQGPEMLYCRPMPIGPGSDERMAIPDEVRNLTMVHLPPLAGLRREEEKLEEGSLNVRIGEGRAGDIIRNLLYNVAEGSEADWIELKKQVEDLFQVELLRPLLTPSSEIVVEYHNGLPDNKGRNPHPRLDLANGGSGFHQVVLLLAFLYARPGSVLLLDEPDAHLEIIRQRDIYKMLSDLAHKRNSQLVVATHSEVILDETSHDCIVSFLGKPHRLVSPHEKSQVRKSLKEIRSSDYMLAEQKGAVLYVEDYTDLNILRAWSSILNHKAFEFLKSPFCVYCGNNPSKARAHFQGLRIAHPALRGVVLIDHTDSHLKEDGPLVEMMWNRREIENYLLVPQTILRFCKKETLRIRGVETQSASGDFVNQQLEQTVELEQEEILKLLQHFVVQDAIAKPLEDSPFLMGTKISDVVLEPFFKDFYGSLREYNRMPKNEFFRLAEIMTKEEIHPEVLEKLDRISDVLVVAAADSQLTL